MTETILITGAGQRVGLHSALALRAQGYAVIATYRQHKAGVTQLQQAGVDCIACDFSSEGAVFALVQAVKARTSSLRAIIHNASSWLPDQPLLAPNAEGSAVQASLHADSELFDAMMHIHAKVPYLLTRALLPQLMANGRADVIALTDFVAAVGSAKHGAYAASRAAMENLVVSMSRQFAPTIKVNAIAPALLMFNEHDDEAYQQKALKKSLLQITPGAEEASKAIQYLLESQYVTGRVLALDGGRHLNLP